MSKPISPSEVGAAKALLFPTYVFDAFNELITQNYVGNSARIYQDDVVNLILAKANSDVNVVLFETGSEITRQQVFERGYLNVEDAYRKMGWRVEYEKPAYNESGRAHFLFSAKSQ